MLLLSVLSLITLLFIIFMLPPTYSIAFSRIHVSIILLLFIVAGLCIFAVVTYTFGSAKHGILASLFVLLYFWLRLNKIFHPMFALLLVALFLTLELLFSAKREEK